MATTDVTEEELSIIGMEVANPPFGTSGIPLAETLLDRVTLQDSVVQKVEISTDPPVFFVATARRLSCQKDAHHQAGTAYDYDEKLATSLRWRLNGAIVAPNKEELAALGGLGRCKPDFAAAERHLVSLAPRQVAFSLPDELKHTTLALLLSKDGYLIQRHDALGESYQHGKIELKIPHDATFFVVSLRNRTILHLLTPDEMKKLYPRDDTEEKPDAKRFRLYNHDTAAVARRVLTQALPFLPAETPIGTQAWEENMGHKAHALPLEFPARLGMAVNKDNRCRRVEEQMHERLAGMRGAKTMADGADELLGLISHWEELCAGWATTFAQTDVYDDTLLVRTIEQQVAAEEMGAFSDWLRTADLGYACTQCGLPRGPRQNCCTTCYNSGKCGFCRAEPDEWDLAINHGGCSTKHMDVVPEERSPVF